MYIRRSTYLLHGTLIRFLRGQAGRGGGGAEVGGDGREGERERGTDTAQTDGVSYAVAIYPYMAEQDDEFDVVV